MSVGAGARAATVRGEVHSAEGKGTGGGEEKPGGSVEWRLWENRVTTRGFRDKDQEVENRGDPHGEHIHFWSSSSGVTKER